MKPVVFIPGFPASELVLLDPTGDHSKNRVIFPPRSIADLTNKNKKAKLIDRLTLPDSPSEPVAAGEPIRGVLEISKQAQSLYDLLARYHYNFNEPNPSKRTFIPIGWDWRHGIDAKAVQSDIVQAIDTLFQLHNKTVVIIVHSTGGLVLRNLMERQPEIVTKIDQILAFGVPWAGTLKSLKYLAKGEKVGLDIGPLKASFSATEVKGIMRHCQAAWDLIPPDPLKTPMQTEKGENLDLVVDPDGEQAGLLTDLGWLSTDDSQIVARAQAADSRLGTRTPHIRLPGGAAHPYITNVAGWGYETETTCRLRKTGTIDWSETEVTMEGDGTVPAISASWLRGPLVRTYFLPIGAYPTNWVPTRHSRIWDAPPLDDILDQVLLNQSPTPFIAAAADHNEVLLSGKPCTIRVTAAGMRGEPLPNAQAQLELGGVEPIRFGPSQRLSFRLSRTGLKPNLFTKHFRFIVTVTWTGGRRECPVIIRL